MAIEYSLTIDSRLESAQALDVVIDALGAERMDDSGAPFAQTRNLQITVTPTSQLRQDVIEETFGFRPTLSVRFREIVHNGVGPDALVRDEELLRATMAVLATGEGDAVLLNNGENLVLQRLGGELEVNSLRLPEDYPPAQLITVPHTSRLVRDPVL